MNAPADASSSCADLEGYFGSKFQIHRKPQVAIVRIPAKQFGEVDYKKKYEQLYFNIYKRDK